MSLASPERWASIQRVFSEALELEPAARAAHLDASCSGDAALRREVERLLAAHTASDGFLDSLDRGKAGALLEAAPADEAAPANIGPYRVVRRLGGGGMGVVYLAYDPRLERPVAVKLLRAQAGVGAPAQRRLRDEAQAASALDHPNIAPIYEIGEADDGRLYIAMAYCEGESLADRIARGPLAPRDAAELARQVAGALAAAHRQGIVHRDVKPANVVISPDGRVRLVDFGVAAFEGRADKPGGAAAGTPAYMSPEQTRGEEPDPRTDLWALGVVMYEMLAGRRPFHGEDDAALLRAIREDAASPVRRLRPEVPKRLARLVERCLAKDPAARPASAASLAAELAAIGRTLPAGRRRSARRRALRLATTGAALAVAVGLAGLAWLGPWRGGGTGAGPGAGTEPPLLILPFAPVVADPALERLGQELVVTLAATLDGAGGLRVVEPITVLGQPRAAGPLEPEGAAALARRLGADRWIDGRLSRAGDRVRLDATVRAAGDLAVLGRAAAEAPLEDITALTESLTLGLLRGGLGGAGYSAPDLAALTTTSVPALRAYLDGERAMAGARFRTAASAFARAIALDSTFWFAYWRYAYALGYHGDAVDRETAIAVGGHHASFPEPERMMVEARMMAGQRERLAHRREITQRFPTYWPAWFELADQLTHHGPFLGLGLEEARAALERTIELNPRFVPAWEHLLWLAVLERDTAASGRALARLTALGVDTLLQDEWNIASLDYYRYLDVLARSGGEPDPAEAELGAAVLAGYTGPLQPERQAQALLIFGFHRAQLDVGQRVIARGARPAVVVAQSWAEALAWAGRGAWEPALSAARRFARTTAHPGGALWAYGLAVSGAWLGHVPPDSALPLRETALRSPRGRTVDGAAEIAWLDGLLACTRGDDAALARARDTLAASAAGGALALDASLAAFQAALAGQRDDAARVLAALEWRNAEQGWAFRFGSVHPFLVPVNRVAAARWLLAEGDTAQAARLLAVHNVSLPGTLHPFPAASTVLGAQALPLLAAIEEARGRPDQARHYDELFRERADLLRDGPGPATAARACGGA